MKRAATLVALLFPCLHVFAASESSDAIINLLNSRFAGSSSAYVKAASIVARDARRGAPLQQFLLAILARDPSAPACARLTDAERLAYFEATRPRIRALAERKDNALAWYLLYLENGDTNHLVRAAAKGNVQALNALGTQRLVQVLEHPSGDDAADRAVFESCLAAFERAAATDDANAINSVGICRQSGYGCDVDEQAAFDCFKRAAELEHPEAINNLARFYREGIVVEKDLAAALKLFRESAMMGSQSGMLNYALALLRGEGTPVDAVRAVELLERIASHGDIAAMAQLAGVYASGAPGVEPDSNKAAVWTMRTRASSGDANALRWLKGVGQALPVHDDAKSGGER